jgi:hypothetical protein
MLSAAPGIAVNAAPADRTRRRREARDRTETTVISA